MGGGDCCTLRPTPPLQYLPKVNAYIALCHLGTPNVLGAPTIEICPVEILSVSN